MVYDAIWQYSYRSKVAITTTTVDLSLKMFQGIHLLTAKFSQEVLKNLIRNLCSEITLLELP